MPKKELKIKNRFRGSVDSRRAFDRMKKSQPVSDSLSKVRSEAGFVRLLQDFIRHIIDNEDMKMSPSQTLSALDRVRKSFEPGVVKESFEIKILREAIRVMLDESNPATTGTVSALKGKTEEKPSESDLEKKKEEERKEMATKTFSSTAAKKFIDKVGSQPANKAIGTGIKDMGDALLSSDKMEKKLKGASPGEIERLVRNYGKELKDRLVTAKRGDSQETDKEKDKKTLDAETNPDPKDLNITNLKNLKS